MCLTPEALATRYGDHYRKSERIEISAEGFEKGVERGDDGEWGVGALVVDEGRALFVKEDGTWLLPGGRLEDGESPEEGAKREVREETGVEIAITGLGAIAEQTFVDEAGGGSYEFYFATFVGIPTDSDLVLDPEDGIEDVAWHEQVPENTFDRELVVHLVREHL